MEAPIVALVYEDTTKVTIDQREGDGEYFTRIMVSVEMVPMLIAHLQEVHDAEMKAREKREKRAKGRRNIELAASVPYNRVHVVKAVREYTGLPLAEAIDVVDALYKK